MASNLSEIQFLSPARVTEVLSQRSCERVHYMLDPETVGHLNTMNWIWWQNMQMSFQNSITRSLSMLSILKFLDISNHDVSSIVLWQQNPFEPLFKLPST